MTDSRPDASDVPQGTRVLLPAVVSPGEAVVMRNSLLSAVRDGGPVVIEAHAVVDLSVQGVQVLLAFIQQAEETGCPWTLHAPSEEFVAALEGYGLFARLMGWPVTA